MNYAAIIAAVMILVSTAPVLAGSSANSKGTAAGQTAAPKTEEAPGFEDFEKGDLSPEDVQELEERREDRNVISPSMQDGEPLPGMDADGN